MILFYLLGISLLIQLLLFVPAYIFKTDKLTDLSYSITFGLLAAIAFIQGGQNQMQIFVLLMVLIWALRLGIFLFIRINKMKRDKRFDGIRESFWKFGAFWLIQGFSVFVILLPASIFLTLEQSTKLEYLYIFGIAIWLTGFLTEAIADNQKSRFRVNPENKGKWIASGLWKYSRHPNYLGEILCWIGIYLAVLPYTSSFEKLIGLLSPLLIIFLLLRFSGIPRLEQEADKRWGDNADYQDYKNKTAVLIPGIW